MTCAQGLLRLLWGGPKLECYGTGRAKGRVRLHRARGSAELREVACGSSGYFGGDVTSHDCQRMLLKCHLKGNARNTLCDLY